MVNLFESGVLDAPAAIAELKAYKTYNQLSFHTPRVIQALRFVDSYEVKEPIAVKKVVVKVKVK